MHAACIIALDKERINLVGLEAAVEEQMLPFRFDEDAEPSRDDSRWDWYQIGGRFTGLLSGYDPTSDPANREVCDICGGTGRRPGAPEQFGEDWVREMKGCNGCLGEGVRVKWPVDWVRHEGDVIEVGRVEFKPEMVPFAFLKDKVWEEAERLSVDTWEKDWETWSSEFYERFIEPLSPDTVLVVVDYHS